MFDFLKKKLSVSAVRVDQLSQTFIEQPRPLKTLSLLVQRNSNSSLGVFEDMNIDLGKFVEKFTLQGDPMVLMAYAYARRSAFAGLYFQGILPHSAVVYVQDIFQSYQRNTGQTVAFQEAASAQAFAYIQSYLPRLTVIHERTLLSHAREGKRMADVAASEELPLNFDMNAEPLLGANRCIDLIDRVIEKRMLGRSSPSSSTHQLRLIDVVEKSVKTKLGAFADMVEDVKASANSYRRSDTLFAAAGMACILGACGAYVAGGVHPNLVLDVLKMAAGLGVRDPLVFHGEPSDQALALTQTYVPGVSRDIAVEILRVGLALDTFSTDADSGRLLPEEVVRRVRKQIA